MYNSEYLSAQLFDIFKKITMSDLKEICFYSIQDDPIERDYIIKITDQREMARELIAYHERFPRDLNQLLSCIEKQKPLIAQRVSRQIKESNSLKGKSLRLQKDIAILTIIPVEFSAILKTLNIKDTPDTYEKDEYGRIWLSGEIFSERKQRNYSLALTCIGEAGNIDSAAVTAEAIQSYRPKTIILMGIAAGMRGKVKIGNVVFAERVVGYENASLRDGGVEESRPKIPEWFMSIRSDVTHYKSADEIIEQRLNLTFRQINGVIPKAVSSQKKEYEMNVANKIEFKISTVASGEKLLRDPNKLKTVRETIHGKVDTGDMEAAGFAEVCRSKKVDWLVIRGISDFGDEFKDDRFHEFAAKSAATVLADFLRYGLDLKDSQ